ncbi:MAG: prepilin-type N-terminal cleavage/methylation domain-containing protein [Bacillota bacterium]
MRGKSKNKINEQAGFTVAELLVAISILLVATASFMPLFTYISQGSQANRTRLTATSLASGMIEQIRSMPYDSVGTKGGNPAGDIDMVQTRNIAGINFTIETHINWVDDPGDNGTTWDNIPTDYKRVKVTVSTPGMFGGKVTMAEVIETLVAKEAEESAYTGGNITVRIIRGWPSVEKAKEPVSGVKISHSGGPDSPQTVWTGSTGEALFGNLKAGQYSVLPDPGNLGMIVSPGTAPQNATVNDMSSSTLEFEVERPCNLKFKVCDRGTNEPIIANGLITLKTTTDFSYTKNLSDVDANGYISFQNIWPAGSGLLSNPGNYRLEITGVSGYKDYELANDPDAPWNGVITPDTSLVLSSPIYMDKY